MPVDDFNRADAISLGSNWGVQTSGIAHIASNAAVGATNGAVSGGIWTASSFTSDQFSQIAIRAKATSGGWLGPTVRGTVGDTSHYLVIHFPGGAPNTLGLYKADGGTTYHLLAQATPTISDGDILKLQATGSGPVRLQVWLNGVLQIDFSDSVYQLTGGAAGIEFFSNDALMESWSADNAAAIIGSLSDGVTSGDTESSRAVLQASRTDGVASGDVESGVVTSAGAQVAGSTSDAVTLGDSESATITSGVVIQPQPPVAGWGRYQRVQRDWRLPKSEQEVTRSVVLSAVAPLRAKLTLRMVKVRGGRGITAYAQALRLFSQLHSLGTAAGTEVVHLSPLQTEMLLGHVDVAADATAMPTPATAHGEVGVPAIKAIRNPTDDELIHLIAKML